MKIINITGIILLVALIGCSVADRKHVVSREVAGKNSIVLPENYIRLCYGLNTQIDTNNVMEHGMQLLNSSNYKGCLELFKRTYHKLDTVKWHSGFYGLIIPDSNIQSYRTPDLNIYNPLDYLSFRYNNFIGDLANDEEGLILGPAVNSNNPDELYKLQHVEGVMLAYDKIRISDTVVAEKVIEDVQDLQKKYPDSKRLDYILGASYLVIGEDAKTIPIYNRLINQNYYALPCLKKLITYLGDRNRLAEQAKYVAIFKRMFPDECLLLEAYNQLSIDSVKGICKKCIETGSQKDSILASIFLAKYLFDQKAYPAFDSLLKIYYREHDYGASYVELKKYEEKIYDDLKVRELFLQKQYNKIFDYVSFNDTDSTVVMSDFKNYIKQLYKNYIAIDTTGFDIFYKRSFKPPPISEWGDSYEKLNEKYGK